MLPWRVARWVGLHASVSRVEHGRSQCLRPASSRLSDSRIRYNIKSYCRQADRRGRRLLIADVPHAVQGVTLQTWYWRKPIKPTLLGDWSSAMAQLNMGWPVYTSRLTRSLRLLKRPARPPPRKIRGTIALAILNMHLSARLIIHNSGASCKHATTYIGQLAAVTRSSTA